MKTHFWTGHTIWYPNYKNKNFHGVMSFPYSFSDINRLVEKTCLKHFSKLFSQFVFVCIRRTFSNNDCLLVLTFHIALGYYVMKWNFHEWTCSKRWNKYDTEKWLKCNTESFWTISSHINVTIFNSIS